MLLCRSKRTSQQLSRASAELEHTRRTSADTFEQLQRSSAELRRSSAELQRMKGSSGSYGQLESLEEGTDKAVQLVLEIISDTAATGKPGLKLNVGVLDSSVVSGQIG